MKVGRYFDKLQEGSLDDHVFVAFALLFIDFLLDFEFQRTAHFLQQIIPSLSFLNTFVFRGSFVTFHERLWVLVYESVERTRAVHMPVFFEDCLVLDCL